MLISLIRRHYFLSLNTTMIVTTVNEVLDLVFDTSLSNILLYEGDVNYLFVTLDDLLINYERCGSLRNSGKTYQLYNVSNGHGKEGKLGVKE